MSEFLSANDQSLEDAQMARVFENLRLTAISEVARRGTTFSELRGQVEKLYGRSCNSHGIDGSSYRVRFTRTEDHPDLGFLLMAYDYTLDLARSDSDWVERPAVAVDPQVAMLLERL